MDITLPSGLIVLDIRHLTLWIAGNPLELHMLQRGLKITSVNAKKCVDWAISSSLIMFYCDII